MEQMLASGSHPRRTPIPLNDAERMGTVVFAI
jgi:hypothetical protein